MIWDIRIFGDWLILSGVGVASRAWLLLIGCKSMKQSLMGRLSELKLFMVGWY